MNYKWIMFALALVLTSQVAVGDENASAMTTLDLDQNGLISKEEAAGNSQLTEAWDKYDVNKDGVLERAEFARFEEVTKSAEPAAK